MRRWLDPLLIWLLSLAVHAVVARWVDSPGYMDAAYYYGGALRLIQGHGFTEPYLWNYVDNPVGLPHPSHLYWMPLPSILAAASMAVFGSSFRAAQIPFLILASLLAPFTFMLTQRLVGDRRQAWLAGLLAIFSGFYFPFLVTTDAFALFCLLGAGCVLLTVRAGSSRRPGLTLLAAGALAGLASLSRADGLLLGAIGAIWIATHPAQTGDDASGAVSLRLRPLGPFLAGFVCVMTPWWIRNTLVVGSPFPPGGMKAAWLLSYDELFNYPAALLTPAHLWSQGWAGALHTRWEAVLTNAQTVVAVHGLIFLLPFAIIGLRRTGTSSAWRLALAYYAGLLALMTIVFPFPGMRGGLFHSGIVLLPFVWSTAPAGIDAAVEWVAARRRGWDLRQAQRVFGWAAVALALALSVWLTGKKIGAWDQVGLDWGSADQHYGAVGEWLDAHAEADAIILVNNPPGFYYFAQSPAIVIPNGDVETVLAVADRYGARYLVLEANHPAGLAELYAGQRLLSRLEHVATFDDALGRPVLLFVIQAP